MFPSAQRLGVALAGCGRFGDFCLSAVPEPLLAGVTGRDRGRTLAAAGRRGITRLSHYAAGHGRGAGGKRARVRLSVDYLLRWNPLYRLLWHLHALSTPTGAPVLGRPRHFAFQNLTRDDHRPPDHWFWYPKRVLDVRVLLSSSTGHATSDWLVR